MSELQRAISGIGGFLASRSIDVPDALRPLAGVYATACYRLNDRLWHLLLPAVLGAGSGIAVLSRYVRSQMLEVAHQDYIRTARAKGLPEETVLYKHALRNALLPFITMFGLTLPGLVGGSVIIESIFSWPGLGQVMVNSIVLRDYDMVMELIRPLLAARGAEPLGRVVIGTVKGDLHDIGKNLVASMLEGGGFEVIDLGADVAPEKFVEAVQARNAHMVALSALLTVTMPAMKTTIEALKAAGLRERVKVMVVGAPLTQRYADEIGADGYGENASVAVTLARRLMGVQAA